MANALELVQKIGYEICEECGPHRDCELEYAECSRITNALALLKEYNQQPHHQKD